MYFLEKILPSPYAAYLATMFAMTRKDLFILKSKLLDLLINSSIALGVELVLWCYIYPQTGMPVDFIAPMFVGWPLLSLIINLGFCFSMKYTLGAIYTGYGFMEYDLTLPVPTAYILAHYIISFLIEASIVTLPLIAGGLTVLSYMGITFTGSILLFFSVYIISLVLCATTFFALSFHYPNQWFENNLWPRRISFFVTIGATFYPWTKVYSYSKLIGIIMLLNPLTYVSEGMRAALLDNNQFIPLWFCVCVLCVTITMTIFWMHHSIRKRLDLI